MDSFFGDALGPEDVFFVHEDGLEGCVAICVGAYTRQQNHKVQGQGTRGKWEDSEGGRLPFMMLNTVVEETPMSAVWRGLPRT